MLDEDGKIVGQKAQWLQAKDEGGRMKAEGKGEINLAVDEEQTYEVTVPTKAEAAEAKVTFSRIVLEDGTMPDPVRSVKPLELTEKLEPEL